MDLRTALEQGVRLLEEAGVSAPRLTAEVLLAHALGKERVYLIGHAEEELSQIGWIHYGRYLQQRMQGTPTQYITKKQEFYGREFRVSPAVLIPRPETEHLVECVLARLEPRSLVVDVGTGSGAVACTLALESGARVVATDISREALEVAAANARALGACVSFACCDLVSAFPARVFDVVASNPPYVGLDEQDGLQREVREHEPHVALFAGARGTEIYARLIEDCRRVLKPGGWLVVELGYRSLEPVRAMLGDGWTEVACQADLAGIPRVLAARWAP